MKKKKKTRASVRLRAYPARGNMDVTAALIRCALACSAFIVTAGALSFSGLYSRMHAFAALLVEAALTLLCFGLPAVYGLFYADGSQWEKLPVRALSAAQLRALAAAGVLLVCPATLLADLIAAPFARMGFTGQAAAGTPPFALFLPMLVKSALLAPVCEELFFRGYLSAVFKEADVRGAAVVSALFFALVHGVNAAFIPRFFMGLAFYALMAHTGSLLAPVLVHSAYNLTILLVSFAGLSGLFSGIGFLSCLIRLPLCAAFIWSLRQAFLARGTQETLRFGRPLTVRQLLLFGTAVILLIVCPPLMA